MSISTKVKIYAVFQFITFISYFILGLAFILLATNSDTDLGDITNDPNTVFISKIIVLIFSFKILNSFGIASSILIYIFLIITLTSWIVGLQIIRSKNRNLLDSLFLLFAFVPLVSNILCLIAQVSSNTIAISYNIDKQKEFKAQYSKAKLTKTAKLQELRKQLDNLK